MTLPLAANIADQSGAILLWSGILLLAVIVLALGVWYYRRRWLSSADSPSAAWTFDDIRKLRESGAISDEEYQALRATLIGSFSSENPSATRASEHWDWEQGADFDVEKRHPR